MKFIIIKTNLIYLKKNSFIYNKYLEYFTCFF